MSFSCAEQGRKAMQFPVEICWKSEEQNTKEARKPTTNQFALDFSEFGIRI
jgi:hypothetical protein